MRNYTSQDKQRKTIMGVIMGLMKELGKLAPHPSRPHDNGPLFVQSNPQCAIAGEHDSMLGQLFMENILAPIFTEAVFTEAATNSFGGGAQEFSGAFGMDKVAESASEILKDRGEGQGSFALCKRRAIADGFNFQSMVNANKTTMTKAYEADLPRRIRVERSLAHYSRKLAELPSTPALELAA